MLTDSQANSMADVFIGTPGQLPSTVWVGALTAEPNADGTGVVEPSGGSYGRVEVDNNSTEWPNATGREKTNANDIVFPEATTNWGTIRYVGIFDGENGSLRAYGVLDENRTVLSGDQFRFLAGSLRITVP